MKRARKIIARGLIILASFAILVLLYGYIVNWDTSKILNFIKSIFLVLIPTIVVCEILFHKMIANKISNDYMVIKSKDQILSFYEYVVINNLKEQIIETYLYLVKRQEVLFYINNHV